jgi:hypothetical protein
MAKMAIGYDNLADAGTLTAGSSAGDMLPSRLQTAHVAERWRSLGTSGYFVCDLLSLRSIGAVAVMGLNLTALGSVRLRLSTADATGAAGNTLDTGADVGVVDPNYGMFVHLLTTPLTARYARIDLADASLAYVQAGRLAVLGTLWQPQSNFEFGWQWGYEDPSRQSVSYGGQTWIEAKTPARVAEFTLPNVRASERTAYSFPLQRQHGLRHDILVCRDTATTNPGEDCIWGLMTRVLPLPNPHFGRFVHRINLAERL